MEDLKNQIDQEIKEIINSQIKLINGNYYFTIRDIYKNEYKLPELQTIKYQICRCITFGFYIAAMTLLNHLLEKFLKISLIYSDMKNTDKTDEDIPFQFLDELSKSNPKYDSNNLYDNIIFAFKKNLITEEQKSNLLRMKDDYRNPYSHSDRDKMYKDNTTEVTEIKGDEAILKVLEGKLDELPKQRIKLSHLTIADAIIINEHAGLHCVPYIVELDKIIRRVENVLFPKI